MKHTNLIFIAILLLIVSTNVNAGGKEDFNDCRTNLGDFCERGGSCAIQGSAWYQYVTINKNEKFDVQGWPGLCDMVHVALVQGKCSPLYVQDNVVAYLSDTSHANIPGISGALACGGDGGDSSVEEICDDGIDNDGDGKIDCSDRGDCRKDSFCR